MSTDAWALVWVIGWLVAAPFIIYGAAYLGGRRR